MLLVMNYFHVIKTINAKKKGVLSHKMYFRTNMCEKEICVLQFLKIYTKKTKYKNKSYDYIIIIKNIAYT